MNNTKLQSIAEKSAENLKSLIAENESLLLENIAAITEENEAQGKESLVINFTHAIKLDLGKDQMSDTLSWSVKHKAEALNSIPDPSQPSLL